MPDPHRRGLRGRRRDRDAGGEGGGRRASTWRSSRATRTSSSWWATASASTTRATRARGSTRPACSEKFGVRAGAGRGRAGADGRRDRQRQGRARHRREGRPRPDRAPTARSTRCWSAPPRCRRRSTARRCSTHADDARQSRELVTIRTDVPVPFDLERFRYRGPDRASAATRCSRRSASGRSSTGVRADGATTGREGLRASSSRLDELDGAGRASCGGRARSACR